jgi:hypothetical protein
MRAIFAYNGEMDPSRRAEPPHDRQDAQHLRKETCVVWCDGDLPESLHAALTGRDIELVRVSDGFTALGALCSAHGRKGPPPSFVIVEQGEGGRPRRVGEVLRAIDIYAPRSVAWAYTSAGGLRGVTSQWASDDDEDERAEAELRPARQAISAGRPAPTLRLTEDPAEYEGESESEELEHQLTDEELSMLLAPPDDAGGESSRGER